MESGIDLRDPAFLEDPYPIYRKLREEAPVYWLPHSGPTGGMWLLTRYHDVEAALRDPRLSHDITRVHPDIPQEERGLPMMLFIDPPDHTRLRNLVSAAFTPAVVRGLETRIEEIVRDLLDQVKGEGEFDLIAAVAFPLPVMVIAELLGVPLEDRERFHAWSSVIFEATDATRSSPEVVARSRQAQIALAIYLQELIAKRRAKPKDDLIGKMIEVRDGGDRLGEEELIGTLVLLLIAGHETTVNLIGNGMLTFMRHRDAWERLREAPELTSSAVEEVLRYESPVQRAMARFALEDFEVGGVRIARGQQVSAVIGSANRDPECFANPDQFDISREPNRHLAFGKGIHFCLGAPLARLEGRIAFRALAERFPEMALVADYPAWRPTTVFRGLSRLAVRV